MKEILRELQTDGVLVSHLHQFLDYWGSSSVGFLRLLLTLMSLIPLLTLFLALTSVSVARFLAIRVGRVAVKRRVPIVVNCLIDLALILPLVLIAVDPTL